jgi:hypothetical protein
VESPVECVLKPAAGTIFGSLLPNAGEESKVTGDCCAVTNYQTVPACDRPLLFQQSLLDVSPSPPSDPLPRWGEEAEVQESLWESLFKFRDRNYNN